MRTLTVTLLKQYNCTYLWAASTNTMLPSWVRSLLSLDSVVSRKNTTDIRQPCPDNVKIVTLCPYSIKRLPNLEENSTTTVRKKNNALIGGIFLHGETSTAQRGVVYVQIAHCIADQHLHNSFKEHIPNRLLQHAHWISRRERLTKH